MQQTSTSILRYVLYCMLNYHVYKYVYINIYETVKERPTDRPSVLAHVVTVSSISDNVLPYTGPVRTVCCFISMKSLLLEKVTKHWGGTLALLVSQSAQPEPWNLRWGIIARLLAYSPARSLACSFLLTMTSHHITRDKRITRAWYSLFL